MLNMHSQKAGMMMTCKFLLHNNYRLLMTLASCSDIHFVAKS